MAMKIYRNKLYSIQDAAKRAGITEKQITEMIDKEVFKTTELYYFRNTFSVRGFAIPGLKKKWEKYQKKLVKGKEQKNAKA